MPSLARQRLLKKANKYFNSRSCILVPSLPLGATFTWVLLLPFDLQIQIVTSIAAHDGCCLYYITNIEQVLSTYVNRKAGSIMINVS